MPLPLSTDTTEGVLDRVGFRLLGCDRASSEALVGWLLSAHRHRPSGLYVLHAPQQTLAERGAACLLLLLPAGHFFVPTILNRILFRDLLLVSRTAPALIATAHPELYDGPRIHVVSPASWWRRRHTDEVWAAAQEALDELATT